MCYLSFPPFWSPVGSHQFKPFHYLGEEIAIILSRKFYHVRSYRYDDIYGKLYKRTIRQVKKLIKSNNLRIKSISTRMSPINFAKIPVLNELLTWHVEFLIIKTKNNKKYESFIADPKGFVKAIKDLKKQHLFAKDSKYVDIIKNKN